ncbi:MAG: hypothetical protein IPH31_24395 [Lewinellaceae bacterium]|nr:hypothetical protein [Lewinellaceae bacterium]
MDKFTIRDILVFFITGLVGLLLFSILYQTNVIEFYNENRSAIMETSTIILLIGSPIVYLLGHFISSMEDVLFMFGKKARTLAKRFWVFKPLDFLFNGYRVQTLLLEFEISTRDFWKMYSKAQINNSSSISEYWHIMSDLFKNIFTITFFAILYSFWWCNYKITILFIIIAIGSWYRSKVFSRQFVLSVRDINSVLSNPDDKKPG